LLCVRPCNHSAGRRAATRGKQPCAA
jgi:hypothetical protein